jgi:predicted DNA-binding transcriptional regulator AlpA
MLQENGFFTSMQIAARYSRTHRTIIRWIEAQPQGFPRPLKIAGRHMWRADDIEAWEKSLAANAARTAEVA